MNELTRMLRQIETRAPTAAVSDPINYIAPGTRQVARWDADRAITEGYLKQVYVFTAVNKIADAIARYPFRAGKNPENPSSYSETPQLAQLLGPGLPGPNPDWSPKQFWKYTIAQYVITGKFAWLLERDGNGLIIGLWPLQAQHLVPLQGGTSSYFSGYEYGTRGSRGFKTFTDEQIIYCWNKSQGDYRQPQGWLEAAALEISTAQMIDQYDYSLLKNNAVPATIVTTEQFAEEKMRRAFRQQFMATYGGSANAGRTLFLEADPDLNADGGVTNNVKGKISVERLALSANEMMSTEKRAAIRDDICVAMRTPASILSNSSDSKYTNMESDYRNWWEDTLVPLASDIVDHVNVRLVPRLDKSPRKFYGWFDFSGVTILQDKPRFTAPDYGTLYDKKIMERNEIRFELGLPKWEDIDHPMPTPEELDQQKAKMEAAQPQVIQGQVVSNKPYDPAKPRALNRPVPATTNVIRKTLAAQKAAVTQRQSGRRARNAETLDSLYDVEYWRSEMTRELTPKLADELAQIAVRELRAAVSIDEAFVRVEREIRGTEPLPLDYVAMVIDAISREKIEPSKAVEYAWI